MKNSIISVMNETAKGLYDAGVMSDASIQEIQSIVFCQDSLAAYAEYGVWGAMEPKTNVRKISTHFIE